MNQNNANRQQNLSQQMNPNNENAEADQKKKKESRWHGKYFIVIALSLIILAYLVYIFLILKPLENNKISVVKIIVFSIFSFLTGLVLWAYFVVMNTHPGQIPLYWGFYIGDDEYKRKRYCLICNAFKPERSHHCSICNVCVLNMDHHCPWVDNCIGFNNRKFFMQLLFFLEILLIFVCLTTPFFEVPRIVAFIKHYRQSNAHTYNYKLGVEIFFVCVVYICFIVFAVMFGLFVQFHYKLVINNSTTIENLDKEHAEDNKKFCLSEDENWMQVFGENKNYWFLPIVCEQGAPKGDGLAWPFRQQELNNNVASSGQLLYNNRRNNNNESERY